MPKKPPVSTPIEAEPVFVETVVDNDQTLVIVTGSVLLLVLLLLLSD